MKPRFTVRGVLWAVNHFAVFFLTIAFVISCCTMLFVTVMARTMELELTAAHIETAAKLTFGNVLLISLLCTVIDSVRRRITVARPAKIITDATKKIMEGDFSVRIPPLARMDEEDAFNQIAQYINQMAEELSGIETLRTDFIASVSHELKTPLAVMGNYGTLLQQPGLSEEQRMEYARAVTEASRRLAHLVTNILRLNKLENQQIYPTMEQYDLGEQLCQCLLQFESVWERKNIEIETDIAEEVTVTADAELLSLVWNNLLSNAFKFTEAGGTVSVKLIARGNYAVVQVTDTGCGMKPEVGAHIFEKFYQGDTSRAGEGNGLGLALVKRVVDILHGEISVESVYGQGSTFTVQIRRD